MSDWGLKEQLWLFWWGALDQIYGYKNKSIHAKARGLSKLKAHIEIERAKQTQPYTDSDGRYFKTFNAFIFWRDKGYCYLCGHYRCYQDNKPMVTEHDIPLVRLGKTDKYNCHLSCWHCNQDKMTLTAAEYRAKINR